MSTSSTNSVQDTRKVLEDDLSGVNGQQAWNRAVLSKVAVQSRKMMNRLHVFGSDRVGVLNSKGSVLIYKK